MHHPPHITTRPTTTHHHRHHHHPPTTNPRYGDDGKCAFNSFPILYYSTTFMTELRFIYNPKAYKTTYSVSDFVDYVDETNTKYGGENEGWSAWYDRHSGIDIAQSGCSMDTYMFTFNKTDTSFNPHGRNNTNADGQATNHIWTPGTEGWGLEIAGSFKYQYADCYSNFDWYGRACGARGDAAGWCLAALLQVVVPLTLPPAPRCTEDTTPTTSAAWHCKDGETWSG